MLLEKLKFPKPFCTKHENIFMQFLEKYFIMNTKVILQHTKQKHT